MYLKSLVLQNFKNYLSEDFEFVEGINCIVGPNGSGKTNLLDAIHMISMTKSAFNHIDQDLINENADFMRILAKLSGKKDDNLEIRLKAKDKKQVFWNENEYDKLSRHIGRIPLVLISPNDTDLIRQGSEIRRRFFDSMISTVDPAYLNQLSDYQKNLRQRNGLLKQMAESGKEDATLLEVYDERLLPLNHSIYRRRKEHIETFGNSFREVYNQLSGEKEEINWFYQSKLESENFDQLFRKNLERDKILQRTGLGIHKDEFDFEIEGKQVKKFASQGQQKSTVLALKLVQFLLFKEQFGFAPILLLDDIFDKLDDGRMSRLMSIISKQAFNQIFVSDAHPERSIEIFKGTNTDIRIFEIEEGKVRNVR